LSSSGGNREQKEAVKPEENPRKTRRKVKNSAPVCGCGQGTDGRENFIQRAETEEIEIQLRSRHSGLSGIFFRLVLSPHRSLTFGSQQVLAVLRGETLYPQWDVVEGLHRRRFHGLACFVPKGVDSCPIKDTPLPGRATDQLISLKEV
jgi:hypothetical protein